MKKLVVCTILVVCLPLVAQETRRTVIHSSGNAAEDTRPNSNQVPDVYAITGHLERIVVLRFKYDTDLLAGLEKMVKQEKIRNAIILSAYGSVRNYQVHQVGNRDIPPKDVFVKDPTGFADIIGMSGAVVNGKLHPHIVLANADKAFGGHLEPDTTVFTFAIVTLGVLDEGTDLSRVDDLTYR